jgi:hypothetical protein
MEQLIRVKVLPKLSDAVIRDVSRTAYAMTQLEANNRQRGYATGPRTTDEMVAYWKQVLLQLHYTLVTDNSTSGI